MSQSHSVSETFSLTNAKYLASKLVSDVYQFSSFYGKPTQAEIARYQDELNVLLAGGYVEEYEFGFKRNGQRIVSWQYRVNASGELVGSDQRSGGIYARANVDGATYFNFMSYSSAWFALTSTERTAIKAKYALQRGAGESPTDGSGFWQVDRSYSSAGVAIERRTFRPL